MNKKTSPSKDEYQYQGDDVSHEYTTEEKQQEAKSPFQRLLGEGQGWPVESKKNQGRNKARL